MDKNSPHPKLKDWLLLLASALLTTVVLLALIRWLAPQLLGIPVDMQLVRVDKKITPVFTVVPTRELVYKEKVEDEGLEPPESYGKLVVQESQNIAELATSIRAIPAARYVDLTQPMQMAALSNAPLYPRKWDGHPGEAGYRVIATTLAKAIGPLVRP
jgi:lysophospholipase L1-like esterase